MAAKPIKSFIGDHSCARERAPAHDAAAHPPDDVSIWKPRGGLAGLIGGGATSFATRCADQASGGGPRAVGSRPSGGAIRCGAGRVAAIRRIAGGAIGRSGLGGSAKTSGPPPVTPERIDPARRASAPAVSVRSVAERTALLVLAVTAGRAVLCEDLVGPIGPTTHIASNASTCTSTANGERRAAINGH